MNWQEKDLIVLELNPSLLRVQDLSGIQLIVLTT